MDAFWVSDVRKLETFNLWGVEGYFGAVVGSRAEVEQVRSDAIEYAGVKRAAAERVCGAWVRYRSSKKGQ